MDPSPNSPPTLDGSTLGSFARMYVYMTADRRALVLRVLPPFSHLRRAPAHFEQPEKTHLDDPREVEKHFQLIYKCRAAAIRLIQPRAEPVLAAQIQRCLAAWEPMGQSMSLRLMQFA